QDKHLVIYDEGNLFSAPRAWWMLRTFGAEKVSILAGGLAGWQRDEWLLREGEEAHEGGEFEATGNWAECCARRANRWVSPSGRLVWMQSLPPCRYSRASLPQRLSAGRKPRLPASWRATRHSSIAMYFRSSPTV
ncbi:3-mercaptopyruvate sulfurtransferase, partial [Salmonella enterica subsp. enterica serovar Heidelberg str. N4541]